jgi:type IV pilus assembly protein PilX
MTGSLRNLSSARQSGPGSQRGVALVVALVLLVVATLIGLAGVRGTNLQERMSANMYDRSLAFQRAESALRAAEDAITSKWRITDLDGVDCTVAGTVCDVVPEDTFTATATPNPRWIPVPDDNNINGDKTPGRPQYFIQFLGTGSGESEYGLDANAGTGSYSEAGNSAPVSVAFYRITARSSSPTDVRDRSLVVLQSTVKRAI